MKICSCLCDLRRSSRSHDHPRRHGDHGHLSSRGPYHQGFEIDLGRVYRSLSRADHPCEENNHGDEEGSGSGHDVGSAHGGWAVGHDARRALNQSARRQKEGFEPTGYY